MSDDGLHDILYKAMKGLGTDEDAIYSALRELGSQQEWAAVQWEFLQKYPDFCGGDLVAAIKDEMSDKEEATCKEILEGQNIEWDPQAVEDVLYKAMKGWGTDEEAVYAAVDQVATQDDWTNLQDAFKRKYPGMNGGDLRAALKSELTAKEQDKVFDMLTGKGVSWSGSRRGSKASSNRGSRKGSVSHAPEEEECGATASRKASAADVSRKGSVAVSHQASQQAATAQRTASRVSVRSGSGIVTMVAESAQQGSASGSRRSSVAGSAARPERSGQLTQPAQSRRASQLQATAQERALTTSGLSRQPSQMSAGQSMHGSNRQSMHGSHRESLRQSQARSPSFSARAPTGGAATPAAPPLSRKASTVVDATGTSPAMRERVRELEDLCAAQDADLRDARARIDDLEAANRRLTDAVDEREDELHRASAAEKLKAEKGTGKSAFFAALPEADKIRVLELTGAAARGQFTGRQGEGKSAFFAALPEQVKVEALEKFNAEREAEHRREKQAKDDDIAALREQLVKAERDSRRASRGGAQDSQKCVELQAENDRLRVTSSQLEAQLQQTRGRLDRALDAIGASAGSNFENEVKVQQARSCMTALLKTMESRQKDLDRSLAPSPVPGMSPPAEKRSASTGALPAPPTYQASLAGGKSPPNLSPMRPVRSASPSPLGYAQDRSAYAQDRSAYTGQGRVLRPASRTPSPGAPLPAHRSTGPTGHSSTPPTASVAYATVPSYSPPLRHAKGASLA